MNIQYSDAVILVKQMLAVDKNVAAHLGAAYSMGFASSDVGFNEDRFREECMEPLTEVEVARMKVLEANVKQVTMRIIDRLGIPSLEDVEQQLLDIANGTGGRTLH